MDPVGITHTEMAFMLHLEPKQMQHSVGYSSKNKHVGVRACVRVQPVVLLLDGSSQRLVVLLNVHEADCQRVPLGTDEFLSVRQVHQLTCRALKPETTAFWSVLPRGYWCPTNISMINSEVFSGNGRLFSCAQYLDSIK